MRAINGPIKKLKQQMRSSHNGPGVGRSHEKGREQLTRMMGTSDPRLHSGATMEGGPRRGSRPYIRLKEDSPMKTFRGRDVTL